MNSNHIATHLRILRGDVLGGEVFSVNDTVAEALMDFNVYAEQNRFATALKTLNKENREKHEYLDWLNSERIVKTVPKDTMHTQTHYKTFPYCPGYRDVLKTLVILTSCLRMDDLSDISPNDVYVHTLMKERIKFAVFNATKSYSHNLKQLIVDLNHELAVKEQELIQQWQPHAPVNQSSQTA